MPYAIKDLKRDEYYRQRPSHEGWYSADIGTCRVYGNFDAAMATINRGNHNVSYPYDRRLVVVSIEITEGAK